MISVPSSTRFVAALWLLVLPKFSMALDATDIFQRASRSLSAVRSTIKNDIVSDSSASFVDGVGWIGFCDALSGSELQILSPQGPRNVRLLARDPQRSLCRLGSETAASAPGLIVASALPTAGARVFAVANTSRYGIGISAGVVAGLRDTPRGKRIQFTAPITSASAGGALLNADGKLIGIISEAREGGQNVNFAVPASRIATLRTLDADTLARDNFFAAARAAFNEKRWDDLVTLTTARRRTLPDDPLAATYAALAARHLNDSTAEELAWKALQRIDPDSLIAELGIAYLYLQRGDVESSLKHAERLLAAYPANSLVLSLLGACHEAQGELDRAASAFHQAIQNDPGLHLAHMGALRVAERRQHWKNVALIAQAAIRLFPDDVSFRYRLIGAYLLEKRVLRAARELDQLPAAERETAAAWYWRGRVLNAQNRLQEAVMAYEKSLAAGTGDAALVNVELGWTYQQQERFADALGAFREAKRLAPESESWRHGLHAALKDGGHGQESIAFAEEWTRQRPQDAMGWRQLGLSHMTMADISQAVLAFERSAGLLPDQVRIWELLVMAYRQTGRIDDARRAWARLRELSLERAEAIYQQELAALDVPKRP